MADRINRKTFFKMIKESKDFRSYKKVFDRNSTIPCRIEHCTKVQVLLELQKCVDDGYTLWTGKEDDHYVANSNFFNYIIKL